MQLGIHIQHTTYTYHVFWVDAWVYIVKNVRTEFALLIYLLKLSYCIST